MPTMTNPNPCIGSAVLDNATDGSALFRALGGHYTSPAQAVCEFIDDSLSSIAANGDEVGEVLLRVTDRGELVELSVTDSGSGIADLGAALTGNVKKCAVGKHPKSEKHGNTAQFSEVERSGTQENCGGIGSGCRLRLRPLPVLRRRQSQRVARIDPNAVVVDKNIAKNDRFDLFSRQLVRRNLIDLLFLERGEKTFHPCVVEAMSDAAEALYHAAARQLCAKSCAGVLTAAI